MRKYAYAVTTGAYVGEILVYVNNDDIDYKFISIPKNINRNIPKDKFDYGIENKIVDIVEKIPKDIYDLLQKQHEFNENSDK